MSGTSFSGASGSPRLQARRRPVTSALGVAFATLSSVPCSAQGYGLAPANASEGVRTLLTGFAGRIRVLGQREVPMRRIQFGGSLLLLAALASPAASDGPGDDKYLFVWAGDQAREAPDFLA